MEAYGRRTEMHTWRGPDTPANYWAGEDWPTSPPDPEVTTWAYDNPTGLLTAKTDDAGHVVHYTYTPDGRMETRRWARDAVGTVTTYDYDPDTGEMTGIDYPGTATPDVTFSYTRLGRQDTITDAVGTRGFESNAHLQLASEHLNPTGGGLYEMDVTRWPSVLQDQGFLITTATDPWLYYTSYHYHPYTGQFDYVFGHGLPGCGVHYEQTPNSSLRARAVFTEGYWDWVRTNYTYEDNRDLISVVETRRDTGTPQLVSRQTYTNDRLGRRTQVIRTGQAYDDDPPYDDEGLASIFGYNSRSELTGTERHEWTQSEGIGDPVSPNGLFTYGYDNIGNRQTSAVDGSSRTYTTNDVNQYGSITNPGEAFEYDPDGNLTLDRQFHYTWDAENRLVEVMTRIEAGQNQWAYEAGDKHVYFTYDYMGRRVRKRVETYNGTSWPETSDGLFVYDGWNPVLVLNANASNAVVRKYQWGLDLSQTVHGAGGIGGLLACVETQGTSDPGDDQTYWFFYDANGNVSQVLNANYPYNNLTIAGTYEYDPYGNTIAINDVDQSGYAYTNPFRFSTKWFDAETGLYNYGHRYYSPRLGRWTNQDPIGEMGGLNVYAFVGNRVANLVDPLGLDAGITNNANPHTGIVVEVKDDDGKVCGILEADFYLSGYGPAGGMPTPTLRRGPGFVLVNYTVGKSLSGTSAKTGYTVLRKVVGTQDQDERLIDWILASVGKNRGWLDRQGGVRWWSYCCPKKGFSVLLPGVGRWATYSIWGGPTCNTYTQYALEAYVGVHWYTQGDIELGSTLLSMWDAFVASGQPVPAPIRLPDPPNMQP
jgi:RHS repeat-associated protein